MSVRIKIGRNDNCVCGSLKKFKNCCISKTKIITEKDNTYVTDKFSTLWCCKNFFDTFTKPLLTQKIKILYECNLGLRYFVKFESLSEEFTIRCNKMMFDISVMFTDVKTSNEPIKHFGFVLGENSPWCISKFSKDFDGNTCSDSKCNYPNLTLESKLICSQMCCINCASEDCPAKQSCASSIKNILGMLAFYKEIEKLEEDNDLIYTNMVKNTRLKNNIPDFLN